MCLGARPVRVGRLPTIDEALGPIDVECLVCQGEGWECEAHPGRPFPHEECAGPGLPCRCRPGARAAGNTRT
jgi:hypothetical protein